MHCRHWNGKGFQCAVAEGMAVYMILLLALLCIPMELLGLFDILLCNQYYGPRNYLNHTIVPCAASLKRNLVLSLAPIRRFVGPRCCRL